MAVPFYPPDGFLRSIPLQGGSSPEENQLRENELFPPLAMKLESCHLNKQGSLPFERCLSFCLIQTSHFSCKIEANWEITFRLFYNTD